MTSAASRLLQTAFRGILGRRLARLSGDVRVSGVHADVAIHRDALGVPSIVARSDEDAWFGLGYCHGQDRAGQLEILVRTVRGTLAEIAGSDAVPIDRLSRRLGFRRVARQQLAYARAEVDKQIRAYARGVNAGTRTGGPSKAHDLVLFGCGPTPFEPEDAQGIMVMLCFALAANWDVELLRLEVLRRDGPRAVELLDACYPAHLPVSAAPDARFGPSAERLAADLRALAEVLPVGGASNAWAVAGARTKSGKPILAADPHLEPVVPPHWYLAHLVTPTWRVRGASFMGIPGFAVGHNDRVAWGVTAAHADNTDLFLEELGENDTIREGDRFVPCPHRLEAIRVKGGETLVDKVHLTPRGPMVGEAFDGAGVGLSISATWLSSRPYTGLLLAHRATSARDIQELFREASASSVCLVSADVDGHIGYRLSVEVPRRKRGFGKIPLPGWEPDTGFHDELVPFEELPRVLDPKEGFVATANNAPTTCADPYFGADFLDGYRVSAIVDLLRARADWDLASTIEAQRDVRSIPWEEMRDVVLSAAVTRATAKKDEADAALAGWLLTAWDGRMASDSVGASVYAFFTSDLTKRLVERVAPNSAKRVLGEGFNPMLPHNTMIGRRIGHLVRAMKERPEGTFEDWPSAIASSLAAAVRALRELRGDDRARWAWGDVRPLRLVHLFSRVNPLLDRVFGLGPIPGAGDSSTIVQGAIDLVSPASNALGVPNLRAVIDLGDLPRSRFSILGGQSGNPASDHYGDFLDPFQSGGVELAWSDADIKARTKHLLRLIPS
ncbi:MAG: penicillin acylase family protein [Polyangiaceae bacterium]